MTNNIFLIPVLASFFVTLFLIPNWIKRAKKAGLVGRDIHKIKEVEIPESGGMMVIAGFAIGVLLFITINTFLLNSTSNFVEVFALLTSVLLITFVAFTDDILGWKIGLRRRTRLILVALSSIPLIAINAGKSVISIPIIGPIELGFFYPLILIPIGIVGATTTYNFLAGYNGLEAGQGIIIMSALALVSYLTGSYWLMVIALCMVAALSGFLVYNIYPARIFPGDSLTYPVGGMIAILSILGNFERITVFFFIPYIIETSLKIRGGLLKQSFSKLNNNGYLELEYDKVYSLSHLAILLMQKGGVKPSERKVVVCIWILQIIFIVLGFIVFQKNIF